MIVFDIETDDLLYEGSRIWCGSALQLETERLVHFTTDSIEDLVTLLLSSDRIIGHNICGFDLPFMERMYDVQFDLSKCVDTYVLSKLLYPNRLHHSLGAWAPKFGKVKPEHEDWSQYSEAMKIRNIEDVKINALLYNFLVKKAGDWKWNTALHLEQEMHYWQALQEVAGVDIDVERAKELVNELDQKVLEIDEELRPQLPRRIKMFGAEVKKPFKKDGSYSKMVTDWFYE